MDHSLSSLLCQENHQGEVVVVDEDLSVQFEDSDVSEDDYLQVLIEKEIGVGFGREESSLLLMSDWIKNARLYAINWILKTRATFGFRFQTAYLSVTYLDRFLSRRFIDSEKGWAFRLLSVACLSLAAKMEECDVPSLSEFPSQDYNFESKVIQRMELLVLSTLEWNMNFTTPFAFLPYFISKFSNQSPPPHIWSNIMQLIFTLMTEVNLMDHRPSVIAAAATLVAIDPHLTRNTSKLKIMSSVSQYWSLEIENIFACYDLIQRLYKEKTERDKVIHSSSHPPPPTGSVAPIDKLEASVVSSFKRRRLTFTDHEEGQGKQEGR